MSESLFTPTNKEKYLSSCDFYFYLKEALRNYHLVNKSKHEIPSDMFESLFAHKAIYVRYSTDSVI